MKPAVPFFLGVLLLAGTASAGTAPKTLSPEKIDPLVLGTDPYRFNGIVMTADARGSGFCAWNQRAFFSAAHVVWGEDGWGAPPIWYPTPNADKLDTDTEIQSRGYYRWKSYASLVAASGQSGTAFSRDVILGYAFEDLIPGTPATLNLNGYKDLRGNRTSMITGYPGINAYTGDDIDGYFLHQTGPGITPYTTDFGRALTSSLITTGPGNSGGPVWLQGSGGSWSASGVLVGGRPSEAIIYAFSSDISSLTRSAAPVVKPVPENPVSVAGVGATSFFFPMNRPKKIPDGVKRYTDFRFNVARFEEGTTVKKVRLSLDIDTDHQGDLLIILQGPGGYQALVHNEEGAGAHDLVLDEKDFTSAFSGIYPNGPWSVRVQDRLRGDIATVNSILLEISVEGTTPTPTP